MTDNDLPALYQAADEVSLAGQRDHLRALRAVLAGSIVAALGGAIATSGDEADWAAFVAAVAFLITLVVSLYLALLRPERSWYDGRAAAESAKSLAWEYAVGGGPFCLATCADGDRLLIDRLKEIVTRLKDFSVASTAGSGDQITEGMRATRGSSLADRRQIYIRERIDDQRTWYSQKARWNGSRYRMWLVASLLAQTAGLVLGFLLAFGVIGFDGLGVLAALAAAIAAWVQAKDHASLAQAYGIAAQELGFAKSRLESQDYEDEEAFAALVDDAEQAISREHTLWLARRGSASSPG